MLDLALPSQHPPFKTKKPPRHKGKDGCYAYLKGNKCWGNKSTACISVSVFGFPREGTLLFIYDILSSIEVHQNSSIAAKHTKEWTTCGKDPYKDAKPRGKHSTQG